MLNMGMPAFWRFWDKFSTRGKLHQSVAALISRIPSSSVNYRRLGGRKEFRFDVASKGLSREEIQSDLKAVFQPEWLRSFQRILVFHTLAPSQLRRIARQELRNILLRDGITSRVVDIDGLFIMS